ncbi:MAG: 23S rRNA-/tRNA-specific pseudouridylate synthase [Myxococcota bacterium]|jgi:23S rRNA-/tRNA-specific pseudouridylate synthase
MLLLEHLKSTGLTTAAARLMMRSGQVFYRGLPTADGAREVEPAEVDLRPDGPRIHIGKAPVLLHRDRHIMIAFKPAGLLSVTASGRHEISMLASMHRRFGTVLPVNILPEEVAGLMVLALTRPLQEALKTQTFDLRYRAIVDGVFKKQRDDLRCVGPIGTRNSLVESSGTGSLDAIREGLAKLGHPILGDRKNAPGRIASAHPSPAIYGNILGLRHPYSSTPIRFDLPLPDDLERLRRKLAR